MRTILRFGCLLLLVGCAQAEPPPVIAYDPPPAPAAAPEPTPPVEVVPIPQPLPLPGQLKPAPRPDPTPPAARVNDANKAARRQPERDQYIDAIQVWPYHPGALYQVYTAIGQVTDIQLEPGEELSGDPAGGDTERWEVGTATSGSGAKRVVHLFVKPKRPGLSTNLIIPTDRRSYHLELHSTDRTYMALARWSYPLDLFHRVARQQASAAMPATPAEGVDLGSIRHRYRISGDDVPWRPVQAFDDGQRVYIEMPAGIRQGEAPPLFIVGPEGEPGVTNYRFLDRWYVVPRMFGAAELRLGSDPVKVVRITRTDGSAAR